MEFMFCCNILDHFVPREDAERAFDLGNSTGIAALRLHRRILALPKFDKIQVFLNKEIQK